MFTNDEGSGTEAPTVTNPPVEGSLLMDNAFPLESSNSVNGEVVSTVIWNSSPSVAPDGAKNSTCAMNVLEVIPDVPMET